MPHLRGYRRLMNSLERRREFDREREADSEAHFQRLFSEWQLGRIRHESAIARLQAAIERHEEQLAALNARMFNTFAAFGRPWPIPRRS